MFSHILDETNEVAAAKNFFDAMLGTLEITEGDRKREK